MNLRAKRKKAGIFGDITVRRIRATVAFGLVEVGDLGGWIEKEENLSHKNDAEVYGNAEVYGDAWVYGNAKVFSTSHLLVIWPIGSRFGFTTFFRDKDKEITVRCGCFLGKIDKFLEKVQQTHGDSKYAIVYRAAADIAKLQIDLTGDAKEE